MTSRLAVAAVVLALAGCASLTPEQYKQRGVREIAAREPDAALESFERAAKEGPADAEAVFLQGAALNRLGRHPDALGRIERARAAGVARADLPFEYGWSLVGSGRWAEGVQQLEQFERSQPGVGMTAELLGRAYLGLSQLDRAEGWLLAAINRDPSLEPDALFLLALVEYRRGNGAATRRYLEALRDDHPGWTWPAPPKSR